MSSRNLPIWGMVRDLNVKIFGEHAVKDHERFINHCIRVKFKLPVSVKLTDVIKQIALRRSYILIGNMIYVHLSKLDALNKALNGQKENVKTN